jgi:hypothetical protein
VVSCVRLSEVGFAEFRKPEVRNAVKIERWLPSPSAGIHAVKAIVTEGLNRDRIEPMRQVNV